MPVIELFARQLGAWAAILGFFLFVAYSRTGGTGTDEKRLAKALSKRWFGAVAAGTAGAAVIVHFYLLRSGSVFVFQSGSRPWIHTAYGLLAVLAIALSILGYFAFDGVRPWLSFGLVIACIAGLNTILRPGLRPEDAPLSQESPGADRAVVVFVQERLKLLGCFEAAGETRRVGRSHGTFDGPTKAAIVSFQIANRLLREESDWQYQGQIRPDPEFPLLVSPLPWLVGDEPRRCVTD